LLITIADHSTWELLQQVTINNKKYSSFSVVVEVAGKKCKFEKIMINEELN